MTYDKIQLIYTNKITSPQNSNTLIEDDQIMGTDDNKSNDLNEPLG